MWQQYRESTAHMTYATLDGMRGAAALLVVLFHEGFWFEHALVPKAYLAVDIFFCLSGFVIAHAYSEKLKGGLPLRQFVMIRLVRLYPLYLLGTVLGLARLLGQIQMHHPSAPSLENFTLSTVLGIFFLPSTSPRGDLYPANTVAWSLAFEIVVNICYAALAPRLTFVRLVILTVVSALGLCIFATQHGSAEMGPFWADFVGAAFRASATFLTGVLVHEVGRKGDAIKLPPAIILILLVAFLSAPINGYAWFDLAFCLVVAPLLVFLATRTEPGPQETRLYLFLGMISYPVYMIHMPMVSAVGAFLNRIPASAAFLAAMSLFFFVALAALVDRFYDRPIRAALRHRFLAASRVGSERRGEAGVT